VDIYIQYLIYIIVGLINMIYFEKFHIV